MNGIQTTGKGAMLRGIYSGATALSVLERQHELIAGNLANIQSAGHRRAYLVMEERLSTEGSSQPGTRNYAEVLDFGNGAMVPTGNPLDAAISGDGFFAVSDGTRTLYTRNGVYHRTPSGELVNSDGLSVLGSGGPITIDPAIPDNQISISSRGEVTANGENFGELAITAFENNQQLIPFGQVYYEAAPGQATTTATGSVMHKTREMSNTHAVTELVGLIVTSRLYEATQRSIRTISDAVQQYYQEK